MQHPIDKFFRDNLADYEVMPNEALWGRIEQVLDHKAGKRFVGFKIYLAAAAGLALLFVVGSVTYLLTDKSSVDYGKPTVAEMLVPESNDRNVGVDTNGNVAVLQPQQRLSVPTGSVENSVRDQIVESKRPPIDRPSLHILNVSSPKDGIVSTNLSLLASSHNMPSQPSPTKNILVDESLAVVDSRLIKAELVPLSPKGYDKAEIDPKVPIYYATAVVPEGAYDELPTYYANVTPTKSFSKSSWAIGGVITPSHSFRTLNGSGSIQPSMNESGLSSLNGGLTIKKFHGNRWVFESGVIFMRAGQRVANPETATLDSPLAMTSNVAKAAQNDAMSKNNSLGKIDKKQHHDIEPQGDKPLFFETNMHADMTSSGSTITPTESGALKQMLDYLEVPLSARFNIAKQKFGTLSFSGGFSANFLVGNSAVQTVDGKEQQIGKTENIQGMTLSSHVGIGLDVPLTSNLTMCVEPIFKYFVTPANHSSTYDFRPYSFGMNTGISYRF